MEATNSSAPRTVTDSFDAKCNRCGRVMYSEAVVGTLTEAGYVYELRVSGSYRQACDAEGTPCGPRIPTCDCKEG